MGSDPREKGAILRAGKVRPIVKYRDTLRSSVQKRLNRSRCCLGCGLKWAQGIVLEGVQIGRGNFERKGRPLQSIGFSAVSCAKND